MSREIRLASRPTGRPTAQTYAFAEVATPPPAAGHVVVRNTHMSVEPYMRGRMNAGKSYVAPFALDAALEGAAVGFVVASEAPGLPVGTWVRSTLGWRDYAAGPATAFVPIDTTLASPSAFLGVLGTPGFTAWIGMHEIARVAAGDVVFISSAAGAVGSIAGQLARHAGARTIGSAGSAAKAAYLRDTLRFDAAFDYHGGDVGTKLAAAAPDGITVYFENVGGEQLEAALGALRPHGRVAVCGMIAGYNDAVPGPRNISLVIGKRLTLRGFIVSDHQARYGDFVRAVAPLLASGELIAPETFYDGLDAAPKAFDDLLGGGDHVGKIVVRLAPEGTRPES